MIYSFWSNLLENIKFLSAFVDFELLTYWYQQAARADRALTEIGVSSGSSRSCKLAGKAETALSVKIAEANNDCFMMFGNWCVTCVCYIELVIPG